MSLSLRSVVIPTMLRGLTSLDGLLVAAQEFCQASGKSESTLMAARLSPTMLDFTRQVQMATDEARYGVARLTGTTAPPFPDSEHDIDALRGRVANTFEYVESVPMDAFDNATDRRIDQGYRGESRSMLAEHYLWSVLIPNFAFHLGTANAILVKSGAHMAPLMSAHALDAVLDRYEAIRTGST